MLLLLVSALCERSFKVIGNEFYLDGKPFRYISGSFHYFRQQPDSWDATIRKMANGGLNAVQTYVPWNLHEPRKGEFNFEGIADLERFLNTCAKYNMHVILRPGPYICAEWDFGGLPYWLLKEPGIVFRTNETVYMKHCDDWLNVLYAKIRPYMHHNGGNIIMVQVENEYGSYKRCNKAYMKHMADMARLGLGHETFLFTTDGPNNALLRCGTLPDDIFVTVDFGVGDPTDGFTNQRWYNHDLGPYVNSEFYPGWLDHWGEPHQRVSAESVAECLKTMLDMGASVNFYMYIGGTNFGFYNGANGGSKEYTPDPTSYDYDAPLSEAGDMTTKWQVILDVIKNYRSDIPTYDVQNSTKHAYGRVNFTQGVSLVDVLDDIATNRVEDSQEPLLMEDFDIPFGFALYRRKVSAGTLYMPQVHDRAYGYVDGKLKGIVQRTQEANVEVTDGELEILVENQGRLNFGTEFVEKKGLPSGVKLNSARLTNWDNIGFDLEKVGNIKFTENLPVVAPAFYRSIFYVYTPRDTFLNPTGWKKGVAFVNGHNIGRYWTRGPQLTLFVPSQFLKAGANELVIFELETPSDVAAMTFDDTPQIDIPINSL